MNRPATTRTDPTTIGQASAERIGFFLFFDMCATSTAQTATVTNPIVRGEVNTSTLDNVTADELSPTAVTTFKPANAKLIAAKRCAHTPSKRGGQNSQRSLPVGSGNS